VSGELQQKLVDALGEDYGAPGDERTVALATTA
jgi:hypothetical protein